MVEGSFRSPSGHGRLERGLESTPRSRLLQGRFGRIFRSLPPADFEDDALVKLARAMTDPTLPVIPETQVDDQENFGLPAGYTYFGQFVDHDISFDPLSSLAKLNDPEGLTNFRTPALDLDGLYGRGPDDQPYMYESDGPKFILGRELTGRRINQSSDTTLTRDLPRFSERAIIGDKRNDENVIVSELHGLFLRYHNYLADRPFDAHGHVVKRQLTFTEIQQIVRWHYQWLVVFDYLPRIIGRDVVESILPHVTSGGSIYDHPPRLHFYDYQNSPFMPVEFSGAAYRFGHSIVRPVYRLSALDLPSKANIPGLNGRKLVFSRDVDEGLNGFREFPEQWGIDWDLFFDRLGRRISAENGRRGKNRVQPAYKIDSSLVNPLGFLPEFSKPGTNNPKGAELTNNLAYRNLKRGVALQLPTGQAVARLMGLVPLPDADLRVGKATAKDIGRNKSIVQVDARFAGRAPLWFYILAEALDTWRRKVNALSTDVRKNAVPTTLGPVGGRIVGEVLIGLILGDGDSFLRMDPNWKPLLGNPSAGSVFDRFIMSDLIKVLPPVD
jgi:hypothetical protein